MMTTASALDRLLTAPAFGLDAATKEQLLREAVQAEIRFHAAASAFYASFCKTRGFVPDQEIADIRDIPPVPVQGFKERGAELGTVASASVRTTLRSSATSGVASTVFIDQETSRRQTRALAQVMQAILGPKRRPFWVFDVANGSSTGQLGARSAATRGFLSVSTAAEYLLDDRSGELVLNVDRLRRVEQSALTDGRPVCVFGFTYVLYSTVIEPMISAGQRIHLPAGSTLIHIGGWKKLQSAGISDERFRRDAQSVFGCDVVDIYGFTEQIGVLYPECSRGRKHAPAFAEVIVRDPVSLKPVPNGTVGVLEFVTPVPHSYAGAAVLTDDLGVVEPCECGWRGSSFRVLGRTQNVELRGCGDVLAETSVRPRLQPLDPGQAHSITVLFDGTRAGVSGRINAVGADLEGMISRLAAAQSRLSDERVDNLIAILAHAAKRWAEPDHPLGGLRQHGLSFLSQWCGADRLQRSVDSSLGFSRLALDGFMPEPDTRRLIRAQPRGLSVHWLAGNAPTIGLLSALLSILAKNSCLLKAPAGQESALPQLLSDIRDVKIRTIGGRELSGRVITDAIAVLQFGRAERAFAERLSAAADIRLAWGGKEAVEAVMQMPRRYGSEDLIFGPRLSLMVIGREHLTADGKLRQLARKAAVDASAFDQYACASPHVVFVEKGGAVEPAAFASTLAEEMDKTLGRLPKTSIDGGVASRIQSLRMSRQMSGSLWCSNGLEWTVVYDEDLRMPAPVYSRSVFVVGIEDVNDVIPLLSRQHQTVGLALEGPRKLAFADRATAQGVDRLPDIGHMTDFDVPWDGMRQLSRLVRWVSLGAPL